MSVRDTLLLSNSSLVELLDETGLAAFLDDATAQRKTLFVPPNQALDVLKVFAVHTRIFLYILLTLFSMTKE